MRTIDDKIGRCRVAFQRNWGMPAEGVEISADDSRVLLWSKNMEAVSLYDITAWRVRCVSFFRSAA